MKNTKIEWTDDTWNPLRGCSRVSEGCRNCYAETVAGRFSGPGQPYEGLVTKTTAKGPTWNGSIKLVPEKLADPLRWTKPRRIFVNSMSDLFHENVPDEYIDQVFSVMAMAPQHTFQVLTKRARRMLKWVSTGGRAAEVLELARNSEIAYWAGRENAPPMSWPLPNVWLGVSVENQVTAGERIPLLLQTPAAVRWISAEPLLGPVDIGRWLELGRWDSSGNPLPLKTLDWVVVGGESGAGARPMHPDWARGLRDQCNAAEVAFLFKQWGEWEIASVENGHFDCDMARNNAHWVHLDGVTAKPSSLREGFAHAELAYAMVKAGKKKSGRILDGRTWDEYPEVTG